MYDDSRLADILRLALNEPPPPLDIAAVHARASMTVRRNGQRRRMLFAIIALLLLPTVSFAYVQRGAIHATLLRIIPWLGGRIYVSRLSNGGVGVYLGRRSSFTFSAVPPQEIPEWEERMGIGAIVMHSMSNYAIGAQMMALGVEPEKRPVKGRVRVNAPIISRRVPSTPTPAEVDMSLQRISEKPTAVLVVSYSIPRARTNRDGAHKTSHFLVIAIGRMGNPLMQVYTAMFSSSHKPLPHSHIAHSLEWTVGSTEVIASSDLLDQHQLVLIKRQTLSVKR